jgi:(p)ppGpp synthase/HD superfamily hydrolase
MKPPTLQDAIRLALDAHAGQRDRHGADYILHPLRVMVRLRGDLHRTVAILHDVVEDSDTTIGDLRRAGFGSAVVAAIDRLTRRDGESYARYIQRCGANPVARRVKLADLEDNMDLRRLRRVTAADVKRLNRYLQAWRQLAGPPGRARTTRRRRS